MARVLIVGAGAAGLMAAGAAVRQGHQVTVLEHTEKPGQKILVTGKGRCNVTNDCPAEEFLRHVRTNPRFLYSSLGAFPSAKTMELFEGLAMELTNIEAHLAPECIAPMIRQGMADGSIHTADANALAEALFVLADIWLSPQTRPTTPAQQRARNLVFQQMTHALGLDLLTDAQAAQLVQLCTPVKD